MNNCLLAGVSGGGWLEDTSLVEKYKISDEEYNKRDGTFRKFKENLASQNAPALGTKTSDDNMQDLCTNIKAEALGPGFWIGVQYDEPLGKHDGMVKGARILTALSFMVQWLGQTKLVTMLNEIPLRKMKHDKSRKDEPAAKPNSFNFHFTSSFLRFLCPKGCSQNLIFLAFESRYKQQKAEETKEEQMAMPLGMALWISKMVWVALRGWVSSCLTVADEFASSLRSGDIGPFHVG
ncbi:hypothetical protein SLEP1_g49192 [Rubroshorea leprosula]|uniref:CAP-Gly domain-containing protein n=1 Tax=Rubroshorea leprosula TaxID=152421 RepID=A0AAV5LW50_9ROSI|nr:hypothetical protein SLEP1_g49192 [Rubroshorea leprosula]